MALGQPFPQPFHVAQLLIVRERIDHGAEKGLRKVAALSAPGIGIHFPCHIGSLRSDSLQDVIGKVECAGLGCRPSRGRASGSCRQRGRGGCFRALRRRRVVRVASMVGGPLSSPCGWPWRSGVIGSTRIGRTSGAGETRWPCHGSATGLRPVGRIMGDGRGQRRRTEEVPATAPGWCRRGAGDPFRGRETPCPAPGRPRGRWLAALRPVAPPICGRVATSAARWLGTGGVAWSAHATGP